MTDYEPLGLVGKIPRDLRDAIYTECIADIALNAHHSSIIWRTPPGPQGRCSTSIRWPTTSVVNLPMLAHTCKTVHKEIQYLASKQTQIARHRIRVELSRSSDWTCLEPNSTLCDTGSAESLFILIDAQDDLDSNIPCCVPNKTDAWTSGVIAGTIWPFYGFRSVAIEVNRGNGVKAKNLLDQLLLCRSIEHALAKHSSLNLQRLESYSLLIRPSTIGAYKQMEHGMWLDKSVEGAPKYYDYGPGNILRLTGRPTKHDDSWLRFLQSMNACKTFEAFLESKKRAACDKVEERVKKLQLALEAKRSRMKA